MIGHIPVGTVRAASLDVLPFRAAGQQISLPSTIGPAIPSSTQYKGIV